MFVKAIEFLSKGYNIEATIIGEVSTREQRSEFLRIKKIITKLKLEKKITLIKNLDNNLIHKYYIRNDYFVLPTNHDPAPYSVLEALSHGLYGPM